MGAASPVALVTLVARDQKQTFSRVHSMSAIPPNAGIDERNHHVRFVPKADIGGLGRSPLALYFHHCIQCLFIWVIEASFYKRIRLLLKILNIEASGAGLAKQIAVNKADSGVAVRSTFPHHVLTRVLIDRTVALSER